ncbi:11874_t:CDS:2, partial [Gigaspora rosea]
TRPSSVYNWQWRSIKEVAVSIAWSKLEKEDRSLLTKEALKNIVFGLLIEKENQTHITLSKKLKHTEPNTGKRSKSSSSQESKVKKEAKKCMTWKILVKEKEKFKLWTNA